MNIEEKLNSLINTPSDINEHLPTLYKYAKDSETITEFGVRWIVSTWAFLAANPKKLTSVDIRHPSEYNSNIDEVYEESLNNNVKFEFIQADTREIEIEECDLLFIDTFHVYDLLKEELNKHSCKVKKYIILHDTMLFAETGEDGFSRGLKYAIDEFLQENYNWKIREVFTNNNGLTILERQN